MDRIIRAWSRLVAWLRFWLIAHGYILPEHAVARRAQSYTNGNVSRSPADSNGQQPHADSPRTPVCLCMIVRNEAKVIERCLRTVRPHVTHWAIVDTGSTDGTQDIVREMMADMPGELIEREWVDFSTNRNQSLDLGREVLARDGGDATGYLFVIDADEELTGPDGVTFGHVGCEDVANPGDPQPLTADAYSIRLRMTDHDGVWVRRVLVRAALPWHYVYELHEVLTLPKGMPLLPPPCLPLEVLSHNDSHRNDQGRDKYLRDAEVLRGMVEREPNNPRHWYYLGQALAGALCIDEAIDAFDKRVSLGGWPEERYYAAWMRAALFDYKASGGETGEKDGKRANRTDADRRAALCNYLEAYQMRPRRAEPLWACAVICNDSGDYALAELFARRAAQMQMPQDALMVHEPVYQWRAFDELIGALARLGRQEEALHYIEQLRATPRLPRSEWARFDENAKRLREDIAEAKAQREQADALAA